MKYSLFIFIYFREAGKENNWILNHLSKELTQTSKSLSFVEN